MTSSLRPRSALARPVVLLLVALALLAAPACRMYVPKLRADHGRDRHRASRPEPVEKQPVASAPGDLIVVSMLLSSAGVAADGLDVLAGMQPDVFGLQAGSASVVEDARALLPGYGCACPDDGAGLRPIFFRQARFEVAAHGVFSLGDPSPGASACSWARLVETATGRAFYVYNVRFTNDSTAAREADAMLFVEHVRTREPADPVVVTGDLQSRPNSATRLFMQGRASLAVPGGRATTSPSPLVDAAPFDAGATRSGPACPVLFVSPDLPVLKAWDLDGLGSGSSRPVAAQLGLPAATRR